MLNKYLKLGKWKQRCTILPILIPSLQPSIDKVICRIFTVLEPLMYGLLGSEVDLGQLEKEYAGKYFS